ncbi:MAG TPA: alanine--tRNA ligase [Pyrinomonadaceae bacterium]|nr:alanine--tRNA ligase [Pyrinomonadaceae bacterium]
MNGNEIRRAFLEYFERHGHKTVHSSPVFPPNDPTILFTNAGMNQFKDVFLGNEKRDYKRAASSQKCIRAGGKHNDLDEVGKTARHHTFFEMLGNFSFGDYFKEDAINFAWDFLVNELKLDVNRLWFTVFAGDDEVPADEEAVQLWIKAGASPDRILHFGKKDNFWQMAETGPCGPNSEINYYLGDAPGDPEKNRADLVNAEEGDTTMEIWNLVFMQYNRVETEKGVYKLEPLPAPSVDTGAGLERMAVVMEGVHSNYETSLIKPIVNFIAELAGKNYKYDSTTGFATRVVADHARTTAFSIADGILPGNEGRSYVLRKIMRRAIYHGREHLNFNDAFFYKVCDFVIDQMRDAYPELEAQREFIEKMVRIEEERFSSTMTVGLQKLEELFADMSEKEFLSLARIVVISIPDSIPESIKKIFTPEVLQSIRETANKEFIEEDKSLIDSFKAFAKLYDTYGTPRDLIRISMEERGIDFPEEKFNEKFDAALQEIQQQSAVGKTERKSVISPIYHEISEKTGVNKFHGYEKTQVEDAKVVALVKDDNQVDELKEGEEGLIVLDETPFYAESGGQVGDAGTIFNGNAQVKVFDTFAPVAGIVLHKSKIEKGSVKVGDTVTAMVDAEKRDATRRNHTATHLVHAALREVLGTHVKQAGSVVAPNYLRFDFTHYQPISAEEIREIEDLVNREILRNDAVNTDLMSIEEAMQTGATALFGEKYGSQVRVLRIGEGVFSKELCGGTHVSATGDIGSFKILSDEAIASGVRRIRAITGLDAFARFREDEQLIEKSLGALKTQRDNLPTAIERLQEELKRVRRENDELKMKIATGAMTSQTSAKGDEAREISGVKVVAKVVEGLDANAMRQLSDNLLNRLKSGVVVLGRRDEAKVSIIVRVSDDLTDRVKAGNVIKEIAPIVGGRGGGKPDMAEGGGSEPAKLSEAIEASYGVIEKMLG